MSITSLSFTFVNLYAPQTAKAAPAAERQAPAEQAEASQCGEHRPASRPNRLVEAMMSALRELGFGSPASSAPAAEAATGPSAAAASASNAPAEAATASDETAAPAPAQAADGPTVGDPTVPATEAQPAAEPAVTVESAVHQFAHELFRALRDIGRGESSEQGSNRIDGEQGGRSRHHGWRREGYGDMAQRLDALSQTFAAPAAVAAASDASPNPVVASSISITLTLQDGQADAPAEAAASATPAPAAAVAEQGAGAAQTATAPSVAQDTAKNPLLEAFSKLFTALKPQAAGAPQVDVADKLRSFLQTLAQAMRPETMSTLQTPQVGGLINVTA